MLSRFKKSSSSPTRLKMLLYGDAGCGKTITALSMPEPAVVDTERGTDWYGNKIDFDVIQTSDSDEIREAIKEIVDDPDNTYKTLVIDSFSILQESIEERYLNQQRIKKGNPNYTFQPLDYKFVKNRVKSIIHDLLAVDMNIVCTAKTKPVYEAQEGDFIGKVVGMAPEVRKEVPYLFDVVIELRVVGDTRMAIVHKDRTNTLPREIDDFTYQKLTEYFGVEALEREPVQLKGKKDSEQRRNRTNEIIFQGEKVMSAGITEDTLNGLAILAKGLSKGVLSLKLMDQYGQDSLLDLREDEAQLLMKDLNGELEIA